MATPIASKERLVELGMDPAKMGSCSAEDQRKIKNRGAVWFNRGCPYYYECEWRDGTEHMEARDEGDTHPRPRNVATKHIKRNHKGTGDTIINSYCPCFQYHRSLKRRDGKNQEIVEVVGGEGVQIALKSSAKHTNPDNSIYFTPVVKEITVPKFPDPTEVPDLFEDVFAGRERLAHKARTVDAEREARLKGAIKKDEAITLEMGSGGTAAE